MTDRTDYFSDYHKDVRSGIRMPNRSIKERLLDKIVKHDGCWIWVAYIDPSGDPIIRLRGKSTVARRVSYELFIGPIPKNRAIRRTCSEPRCVAPEHIELRPLKVHRPIKKIGPNDIHKHWSVEAGYRALARAIGLFDDSRRISDNPNKLHNISP